MRNVVEGLKKVQVLRQQDITAIKNYISLKNPTASQQQKAAILADALHRVIEKNIGVFDTTHRVPIRASILQWAVLKNHYNIHGDDIFRACLFLDTDTEEYFEAFTSWVNAQQEVLVSYETLHTFTRKVKKHAEDLLEYNLDMILTHLEDLAVTSSGGQPSQPIQEYILNGPPPQWIRIPYEEPQNPLPKKHWMEELIRPYLKKELLLKVGIAAAVIFTLTLPTNFLSSFLDLFKKPTPVQAVTAPLLTENKNQGFTNALPHYLKYKPVDQNKLKSYLAEKKSLLIEEPYFSAIISAADEFNVNPLLLFAIAGHEQSFVPKTHKDARRIANNPFNVYQSWQAYNTTIEDASRITARTIVNASKKMPKSADPFQWINRKYAEDQKWWIGVRRIYQELENQTSAD